MTIEEIIDVPKETADPHERLTDCARGNGPSDEGRRQ
jgi:hypothetical protein